MPLMPCSGQQRGPSQPRFDQGRNAPKVGILAIAITCQPYDTAPGHINVTSFQARSRAVLSNCPLKQVEVLRTGKLTLRVQGEWQGQPNIQRGSMPGRGCTKEAALQAALYVQHRDEIRECVVFRLMLRQRRSWCSVCGAFDTL